MMDMIERVALHMYEAEPDAHRFPDWGMLAENDGMRLKFMRLARSAMEAMREPTQAMIEAGAKGSGEDSEDVAVGAWEAMIDAALTRPTPDKEKL